jgi:hypothetical protein
MTGSRAVLTVDENAYTKKLQCLCLSSHMHGMRDADEVAEKGVRMHSAVLLFIVARILQDTPPTIKRRKKEGIKSESKCCFKLCRISRTIRSSFYLLKISVMHHEWRKCRRVI